jgi:hypothetical protein
LKAEGKAGSVQWLASVRAEAISSGERGPLVLDLADREPRRSPLSLRELWIRIPVFSSVDLEAGRFELGWGKTDGYSPADAFLPRDHSDIYADEKLPVWGLRARGQTGPLRFDALYSPVLTPFRLPVLEGRNAPLKSPIPGVDFYLIDGAIDIPRSGFGALRLLFNQGEWDLGLWGRFGTRPAPLLTIRTDMPQIRPDGVALPADRSFAREEAAGIEISRVLGGFVVRAEFSALFSSEPALGDALIWTLGGEKSFGDGSLMVTLAVNSKGTPVDPILLFDRSILPALVSIWTRSEDWGNWRAVWMQGLRHGDGILKGEITYNLDDVWSATGGADFPYGSSEGPFGSRPDTKRLRASVRRSW